MAVPIMETPAELGKIWRFNAQAAPLSKPCQLGHGDERSHAPQVHTLHTCQIGIKHWKNYALDNRLEGGISSHKPLSRGRARTSRSGRDGPGHDRCNEHNDATYPLAASR